MVLDLPRGNAAPKAPPPAPAANIRTANNPRGVAIVGPRATPTRPTVNDRAAAQIPARAMQAFHTSEAQSYAPKVIAQNHALAQTAVHAYDRHQAAMQLIQLQHELAAKGTRGLDTSAHISGGGLGLSSIVNPLASAVAPAVHIASEGLTGAAHVAEHLGSDLVHLPESTIQSIWELGKAPIHDALTAAMNLAHGASGSNALPTSDTVNMLKGMAKQDPLFQLATLHPGKAGELAYQHPLTAISDLGAVGGILGRVAGAGARAAGVAEDLRPLARAPQELPGGITPIERRFSPNLIVAKGQQALDARGGLTKALPNTVHIGHVDYPLSGFEREMYRRGNEHQLVAESVAKRAEQYRRQNPIIGPGAKPIAKQIEQARSEAHNQALIDTLRQNALTNPRTGDIFYSGKDVPRLFNNHPSVGAGKATREMQQLADQGTQFVRRQLPPELTTGREPVSVIIPKTLHDTLTAHRAVGSEHVTLGGKMWRFGTQRFRRTVLPFSTKWIAGNATEATLRSALGGVGPGDRALGVNLIKAMRNNGLGKQADALEAHAFQGTHFAFQSREAAKYSADHPVNMVPGLARAAHLAGKPADASFAANQRLEQTFAHAVLGKHASAYLAHIKRTFPNLPKGQQMALLAKTYAKPEVATDAGRFARKTLGQYAAFGPTVGKFTHNYAPFAPWYGNSVKFMGTLPFRHPVATASILNSARATDKQWAKEHQAVSGLGGDVQSFPMTGKFNALDIGRFIPPGAFSAGVGLKSPLDQAFTDAGQVVLPQVSDAVKAYFGLDPFGKPLAYPGPVPGKVLKSGKPSKATVHYATSGTSHAANAISDILGSMLGPTQQARRIIAERGKTPYSGTDLVWNWNPPIKGGARPLDIAGLLAGLNKVLNPLKSIDLQPRRKAVKSSSSGGSGFGGGSRGFGGGGGFGSGSSGF